MNLEAILYKVDNLLLVESLPFKNEEKERTKIEKDLSEIYDKPFSIELLAKEKIEERNFENRNNSLVLFNVPFFNINPITYVLETKKLCKKLESISPQAEYIIFSVLGSAIDKRDNPVRKAMEMILTHLGENPDSYLDHFIGDFRNRPKEETILEYLKETIGGIRHSIGSKKDEEFLRQLSQRYMEGNCQTRNDKTFLIISRRLENLKGKFDVIDSSIDFSTIDFRKYAAILVDNDYSFKSDSSSKLGEGIKVLEKLDSFGIKLPIIYQTAHLLSDFSDEDMRNLRNFKNVLLMPKNRAFKICKSNQAKKEIGSRKITSKDQLLSRYCVEVFPIGEKGYVEHENYAVLATNAVNKSLESSLSSKLGLKEDNYSHRMAVLAAFHTVMKSEVSNPLFKDTIEYLRPWKIIESGLEDAGFKITNKERTNEIYTRLYEKHKNETPTTIIHNDPKWDNWFNEYILGDFADCGQGTEYKDIARALLDKENNFSLVHDPNWINTNIATYLYARKYFNRNFEQDNNFLNKVKELIFIESLRLARFEAQIKGNEELVQGLLSVTEKYQERLLDSYKTIPKSGDNAPYNNLIISI